MLNKKNAFTLAELMLVFTVIGILTAILIPGLFSAAPDQSALKAKKAYNTITRAVQTLMNTEPYLIGQTLAAPIYIQGTSDNDKKMRNSFFCTNLADILNSTDVDCTYDWVNAAVPDSTNVTAASYSCTGSLSPDDSIAMQESASGQPTQRNGLCTKINKTMDENAINGTTAFTDAKVDYSNLESNLDTICDAYFDSLTSDSDRKKEYNFKTADGTLWGVQLINYAHPWVWNINEVKIPAFHGVVCFSTDKFSSKDYMFGVGIRADGKVHPSTKLSEIIGDED